MLASFVPEVVVDTLLFQQAADEIEIRLAILNAVLPLPVAVVQFVLEIGETVITEYLFHDIGHLHLLIDAAIRSAGEKPEPGVQNRAVVGEIGEGPNLSELADKAVEIALLPPGEIHLHRHLLP